MCNREAPECTTCTVDSAHPVCHHVHPPVTRTDEVHAQVAPRAGFVRGTVVPRILLIRIWMREQHDEQWQGPGLAHSIVST